MIQVDNANGASLKNYAYDDAFRITGISDALDPALSWTYGYDSLDRLNSATSSSVSQGWTYDANGNRLTETGNAPSSYTNSTTSNRVSSISGTLARSYSYDNAGNTLAYAGATFTFNNRGRMVSASNAGVTATYTYNALGQRIRRAAAGVTTLYVYDEAGHLAGEYTGSGELIQETVWLGDMPMATLRPDGSGGVTLYYVHADHLNTPRLVTDAANNIRWRWDSDPFGTTVPNENPFGLGEFEYSQRLPGQLYDSIVSLHYNYHRDFDPAIGRYLQSDPIGFRGGLNTYAYVRARPTMRTDRAGLCEGCEPLRPHENTMFDVARREVARFLWTSIYEGREYCGWICQDKADGKFFAMPGKSTPWEDNPEGTCIPMFLEPCPECSIRRALWHTHGRYSYNEKGKRVGDDFSRGIGADTGVAAGFEIDLFVGTPGRELKYYHLNSGETYSLGLIR